MESEPVETPENLKKEANYRYWVKDESEFFKGVEKPDIAPKKTTEEE